MATERKYRRVKELPHGVADTIEALRASYAPFDLFWDVQRRMGVDEEISQRSPHFRNFLSELADNLERKESSWRHTFDPWVSTVGEHLAIADKVGSNIHQYNAFNMLGQILKAAVELKIVVPYAQYVEATIPRKDLLTEDKQ